MISTNELPRPFNDLLVCSNDAHKVTKASLEVPIKISGPAPCFPAAAVVPSHRTSRHHDEKPITATPLESAFTNCDTRNPFRMRIYENCRARYQQSHSGTHPVRQWANPHSICLNSSPLPVTNPWSSSVDGLVHRYFAKLNRFCTQSSIVPWTPPGYTLSSTRRIPFDWLRTPHHPALFHAAAAYRSLDYGSGGW